MSTQGTYVVVSRNEFGITRVLLTYGEKPYLTAFVDTVRSVLGRTPTDLERSRGCASELLRHGATHTIGAVNVYPVSLDPALLPGEHATPGLWGYEALGTPKSDDDVSGDVVVYAKEGGCVICEMNSENSDDLRVNRDDARLLVAAVNLLKGTFQPVEAHAT